MARDESPMRAAPAWGQPSEHRRQPLEVSSMKKLLATLIAGTFVASTTLALAQTTPPTAEEKAKAKAEKEAKFKATEQTLQQQSNQMPGANVGGSTAKTSTGDRTKLQTKEQKAAAYQSMQKASDQMPAGNVGGSTA